MCRCGGVKYALAGTAVADRCNLIYCYRANVRRTYIVNKKKKKWFFTKKKKPHRKHFEMCLRAKGTRNKRGLSNGYSFFRWHKKRSST